VARQSWISFVVSLATLAAFTLIMLALRPHLSVATDALLLVVPVVVGVATGGFTLGLVLAALGFLIYDLFFIPPYGTLEVGAAQNWAALFVYLAVVVVVARVVSYQQIARARAHQREAAIGRLYALTEQLLTTRSLDETLDFVAQSVRSTFSANWVALLLPEHDGQLRVCSVAADQFTPSDRAAAESAGGDPQPLTVLGPSLGLSRVALSSPAGPVGQLAITGAALTPFERELLGTFANQAALAIERSQLREQASRAAELEAAERWRAALMGAVSHDLRTPLAAIKVAVGTLRVEGVLDVEERDELMVMIESEADRLAALVADLLDSARLQAGTLTLRRESWGLDDLVEEALATAESDLGEHHLHRDFPANLPEVDADPVLIGRVLANLLSNAAHHSPLGSDVSVSARRLGDNVEIAVSDHGPGVPRSDRERIFQLLPRQAGADRAGLGLALSQAFCEAHETKLRVDDAQGGGARFSFTLPVAVPL
jgi:two-component system sensor histidine kinase KdpD